ncbi:MAG: recombinase family protein [Eubacteriales bacterium]
MGASREQFNRLHAEAYAGLIDIVFSTTIARFGRDAKEVIESLRILRACDVRVIFEEDGLDSYNDSDTLMIELYAAIAQAENENRSESIKWGYEKRAKQGESKLYNRKTFGYKNDNEGNLEIVPAQADTVKLIFSLYLSGLSILRIIRELKNRDIKSPTGKDSWNKRSIDTMLSNEKYTGRVILLKNNDTCCYEYKDHHESIISEDIFSAVQSEKVKRSNIENGKRKSSKYSSKSKGK